jgi:C1A family cysteine protease
MPPNVTPIDWVEKGWVSPIKNQGNCASGYAFSAVANL